MPDNFVKIYRSILTSSVWEEDPPTKVVWITMLAYADLNGVVWATIPGLARLAGVTRVDCERAVKVLSSPDKDSRTPDHSGRRIIPVEGGWNLLNHSKYRAFRTPTQVKNAERVKRHYDKHRRVRPNVSTREVGDSNGSDAQIENKNENEIEKENEKQTTATDLRPSAATVTEGFLSSFNAAFGRRCGSTVVVENRIKARLREGFAPWQIIALPIIVAGNGPWRPDTPDVLLRDGKHSRTTAAGYTAGATDHLNVNLQRIDKLVLNPRLQALAEKLGVLEPLLQMQAKLPQESL